MFQEELGEKAGIRKTVNLEQEEQGGGRYETLPRQNGKHLTGAVIQTRLRRRNSTIVRQTFTMVEELFLLLGLRGE